MLSPEDNQILTRTGAGTPMGDLFRSYWIPVLLAGQLSERDGPPVRVKVMGEELLAFRDTAGEVGLVEPRCPHRGANLFFGRNEQGGIRCSFHGWKFNVRGDCLEMPTIAPEVVPKMCEKARIKAYPTREWGGFVWAYLGERRPLPALPEMEFALVPPAHRYVSKKLQECNWAQAAEGAVDTAHFSFLHQPVTATDAQLVDKAPRATHGFSPQTMSHDHVRWMRDDARPQYEICKHDAGLVLGASRQAGDGKLYWRIAQYLMPNHAYSPSATEGQTYHGQTWVPIDDHSCWVFLYSWNPSRPLTDEELSTFRGGGAALYPEVDANWVPLRNRGNDYLIDRAMQKSENFTGIVGVAQQDAAIQDSQGFIADRTRELLGPTDIGVVHFRKLVLGAARELPAGQAPPGLEDPGSYRVRAGGIVAPATLDFPEVMEMRFGDKLGRVAA